MPSAPVTRLSKKELVWLGTHKCKHKHTYLEHYGCYLDEHPEREKVGFFDIETSHLRADMGIIFSYAIKEAGSKQVYHRCITKDELMDCLDKKVVKQCINDLTKFDRVVTYYGGNGRFDLPFIRTRALYHNIEFPCYGSIYGVDVYSIMKGKFKLSRNRLDNACRVLVGKTQKTYVDPVYWLKAIQGDKKSLDYIVDHNIKDVKDLEKLYNKVINYQRAVNSSI